MTGQISPQSSARDAEGNGMYQKTMAQLEAVIILAVITLAGVIATSAMLGV